MEGQSARVTAVTINVVFRGGITVTQSMTGFARGSVTTGALTVTVECRSVNNRYLDLQCRMPDALRSIESALREHASLLRSVLSRTFRADCNEPARGELPTAMFGRASAAPSQKLRAPQLVLPDLSIRCHVRSILISQTSG